MAAEKEPKTEPAIPKGMKKRKDLPSVAYLLKHGDPETAHIPPTWAQIIGYPFILAMIFALSLFVFHSAPWDSMPAHKPYTLPTIKKVSHLERKMHERRVPHLNKPANTEL